MAEPQPRIQPTLESSEESQEGLRAPSAVLHGHSEGLVEDCSAEKDGIIAREAIHEPSNCHSNPGSTANGNMPKNMVVVASQELATQEFSELGDEDLLNLAEGDLEESGQHNYAWLTIVARMGLTPYLEPGDPIETDIRNERSDNRRDKLIDLISTRIQLNARLHGLVVLLSTLLEQTGSMEDLNSAIRIAQAAVDNLPGDHSRRALSLMTLGNLLSSRFERTGSVEDLTPAIDVIENAVKATSASSPDLVDLLYNLGSLLNARFEQTEQLDDLNRAIEVLDMATNLISHESEARPATVDRLGTYLTRRFDKTGEVEDLNHAIELGDIAIDATSQEHPDRPSLLINLGSRLFNRFILLGLGDDINRAIEVGEMALAIFSPDNPERSVALDNLGTWFWHRSDMNSSMDDLQRALDNAKMAVAGAPENHPDQAMWLNNLGNILLEFFHYTGEADYLDSAINCSATATETVPQGHSERNVILYNHLTLLNCRFEQTGQLDDLRNAIELAQRVISTMPDDDPDRVAWLNALAIRLGKRFKITKSVDDLHDAIKFAEKAVEGTSQENPEWTQILHNLGSLLGFQFEQTESSHDLDRAIEITSLTAYAARKDDPDRFDMLNGLREWLQKRFDRSESADDLDRLIEVTQLAIEAAPNDYLHRDTIYLRLDDLLFTRFKKSSSMEDLNRAIEAVRVAMSAPKPDEHPDHKVEVLNRFANRLGTRFEQLGPEGDLETAIQVLSTAAIALTPGHHLRATTLNNLAKWIGVRFLRFGSIQDLSTAIENIIIAIDESEKASLERVAMLSQLGEWLGRRAQHSGAMDDLNHAIEVLETAVNAIDQHDPDLPRIMNILGIWLGRLSERSKSVSHLEHAIKVIDVAVERTPQGHPRRAAILDNLGHWLGKLYDRSHSPDHLNRAINVAKEAVDTDPHFVFQSNLGTLLFRQFNRTSSLDDLDRAIDTTASALDATPQGHPDLSLCFNNLGTYYTKRYEITSLEQDLTNALTRYLDGWNLTSTRPANRMHMALCAAKILAFRCKWGESSKLLEEVIRLFPTLVPRSLKHLDQQQMLEEFDGLASMAAATTLNAGGTAYHALSLLELGRGVINGLLFDMRTDVSALSEKYPVLAEKFISISDGLESAETEVDAQVFGENIASWESWTARRRHADQSFSDLVAEIRDQPGFKNFLLPPAAEELIAIANPDPLIVLNATSYRCDAFLITGDGIEVLSLPDLNLEDIKQHLAGLRRSLRSSSHLTPVLEWLWNTIAKPILEALGFHHRITDNNWPRVRWIPTGILSQFPLHAATRFERRPPDGVLDRVMSSYSLSIKALDYARRNQHQRSSAAIQNAVLVAMKETPGLFANRHLPYAENEINLVENLCPSLDVRAITPIPRKEDVLSQLRDCTIFHFAGHGRTDSKNPSRSGLLLEDWETNLLTVGDFRECRLQENPPFLGYLSACSTGANEAENLSDEGIHLISGLQLAGFRHIIGTLWEVSDQHSADVARVFYETVRQEGLTDLAICRGLHQAIRALRDATLGDVNITSTSSEGSATAEDKDRRRDAAIVDETADFEPQSVVSGNTFWVPYVHFGV